MESERKKIHQAFQTFPRISTGFSYPVVWVAFIVTKIIIIIIISAALHEVLRSSKLP